MTLTLGPLSPPGWTVHRSGIRWMVPDGTHAAAHAAVASVSIALRPVGPRPPQMPFAGEAADLHAILTTPRAGLLRHQGGASLGGELDYQVYAGAWNPDAPIGTLDGDDPAPLRLSFAAGRRVTDMAGDRTGLLSGWHSQVRAWHGEAVPETTILNLGICETAGVFRGDRQAFLELLEASPAPIQAISQGDQALVLCAPVLLGRLTATPGDQARIAADLAQGLPRAGVPGPQDYMTAGALLDALAQCPITQHTDVITRATLTRASPPATIVLSSLAEAPTLLRHRKLGYVVNLHAFRIATAGEAMRVWLRTAFEPLRRTLGDIGDDYRALARAVAARTGARLLVVNALSSSGAEDVTTYLPFPGLLSDTLAHVRAKAMNLLLHELEEEGHLTIVDSDAIGAAFGHAHIPDGVHQSRPMQDALRQAVLATALRT